MFTNQGTPLCRRLRAVAADDLEELKGNQVAMDVACEAQLHGCLPQSLRYRRPTQTLKIQVQAPWIRPHWQRCVVRPSHGPSVRAYDNPCPTEVPFSLSRVNSGDTSPPLRDKSKSISRLKVDSGEKVPLWVRTSSRDLGSNFESSSSSAHQDDTGPANESDANPEHDASLEPGSTRGKNSFVAAKSAMLRALQSRTHAPDSPSRRFSVWSTSNVDWDSTRNAGPELSMKWSDDELRQVFRRFGDQEDKDVHIEDLAKVLRYLGEKPLDEDIKTLVNRHTNYSSLDWTEFMSFMHRYREFDLENLLTLFQEADQNGNHELDFCELHTLLMRSGYSPTIDATLEAFSEIDQDGNGTVDFEEFEKLREHLRNTYGFLKAEAEELKRLYVRVAGSCNKGLPVSEVPRIVSYLGFAPSQGDLEDLLEDIDRDGSSTITYEELLKTLRGIRDLETTTISQIFATRNSDRKIHKKADAAMAAQLLHGQVTVRKSAIETGDLQKALQSLGRHTIKEQRALARKALPVKWSIPTCDIQEVMAELGYLITVGLTFEVLESMADELDKPDRITPEELSSFMRAFRDVEGFTQQELADLQESFQREQRASVAGDCDDSLDALELGRVLRWFGISKPLQQVQRLIEQIDFDASGSLEFDEFTKLMRQLLQADAWNRRRVFEDFTQWPKDGSLPVAEITQAFSTVLDAYPDEDMMELAMQVIHIDGEAIDILQFEALFKAYRTESVKMVRQNAGYIRKEVETLKTVFVAFDHNRTGYVGGVELRMLIAENMPEATRTKDGQDEILRLLREVAPNVSGPNRKKNKDKVTDKRTAEELRALDFQQFLWLTRRLQDHRDEQDILKEAEVAQHIALNSEEIEDYRGLFLEKSGWMGEMDYIGIKDLLSHIQAFSPNQEEELRGLVKHWNPFNEEFVRFPQFLRLMDLISKDNRLGLNDSAQRALRRQEYLDEIKRDCSPDIVSPRWYLDGTK